MARTKNRIAPEDTRAVEAMELVERNEKDKQLAAREAVKFLGFDLKEYDLFTYIQMGRNVFRMHEMTAIAGGKILCAIKENETHGTFGKAIEEIGIHPRKAQRYMNLARRFGKYDNLSHLGSSKLELLENLSDPELEKLDDGGDVKGLTLDEIDRLPAHQARERLRASEKKLAKQKGAHAAEVGKLNETIGDLRVRAEDPMQLTDAQRAHWLIRENYTQAYTVALGKISSGIREAMSIIGEAQRTEGVGVQELSEWLGQFDGEMRTFHEIREAWTDAADNAGPTAERDIGSVAVGEG